MPSISMEEETADSDDSCDDELVKEAVLVVGPS
jgi:hypothetical protein